MTRVIHTGDTHMGYTQYHSPVRRQDFLDAFAAVIDDAIEGEVDAVVHAGDLFRPRPELTDLMGTISILRRLDDAGVPFPSPWSETTSRRGAASGSTCSNERLGLATRLGDDPTVVGDTSFYGLDHVPVSRRDDLLYYVRRSRRGLRRPRRARPLRAVRLRGLGHGNGAHGERRGLRRDASRRQPHTRCRQGRRHVGHVSGVDRARQRERARARGAATTSSPSTPTPPGGRRPRGDPAARARHPPVRLRGSRPSRGRGRGAGAREGPPTRPRRRRRPRRRDRRGTPSRRPRSRSSRPTRER